MAANELYTKFIFDEKDGNKVDLLHSKLVAFNNDFNNLGKNTIVGKTIANNFDTASNSIDNFKNKINDVVKPTISRHWENETDKVVSSVSKIEAQTSQTIKKTTGLINAGAESLKRLGDLPGTLGGKEMPVFAEKYKSAFIDLESRSKKLASSFQKLSETKVNKGQFDSISQGAYAGERRVIELTNKIARLKKEAADPENAKFGKYYADGLKEAERELARFERKLINLKRQQTNSGGGNSGGGFGDQFSSRLFGQYAGLSGGAIAGGLAAGAALAAITTTTNAISTLADTAADLTVKSIKLAGDFEESTNSLAVFAGGASNARRELQELDELALKTPGLKLETAEAGYNRLRALNFQAKTAQDLIRGLGISRAQSGADQGSVDRVITNLTQLTSGSGTAADVRQTIGAIPSLRRTFRDAFGTTDFGELNRIAKERPDEFIRKFTDELNKAKTAQVGLNLSVEKFLDNATVAGRDFGEPFLKPLTRDVQLLTKELNDNRSVLKSWGQDLADVYNGLSGAASIIPVGALLNSRTLPGVTDSIPAQAISFLYQGIRTLGEARRKAEDKANPGAEGFAGFDFGLAEEENEKSKKRLKERQKIIDLQKQVDASEIENNLNYSKAIAASRYKGFFLVEQNARLETDALRRQIEINNQTAEASTKNLSNEDLKDGKDQEILKKAALENAKLQNQIDTLQINSQAQIREEIKKTRIEYQDFLVSVKSQENPFIKVLADIDTAGRRAQDRFGNLGKEFVKAAAEAERSGLLKQLNLLSYESGKKALNFEQDAFRTSRIRDNQFASFERSLKTVETKVEFAVRMFELDRKIDEADFYGRKFNPNNPNTFDQSRFSFGERYRFAEAAGDRKRGESLQEFETRRKEAIESGIKIFDAFNEIKSLKNLSTEGTGIFGEGAIADKILGLIPSQDDLLLRLKSPYAAERERSQSLLNEQTKALKTKRDLENQKLNDFLYDQETAGLNKKFAYDQLALLNNQKGLTKGEYAQNFLDITKGLGNDLDPYLRRGQYEQNLIAAKEERAKENEAREYWKTIALATAGLNEKLNQIITANGLLIDGSSLPATNVQVNAKDFDVKTDTGAAGTMEDQALNYLSDLF